MIAERKVLSPWRKFENAVVKALRGIAPNLGAFSFPIYAKVVKANFNGGKVDSDSKRFSLDVQPLRSDLREDPDFQEIKDVPMDSLLFDAGGAVYTIPPVGAIVRVGFMYSDPSYPFIISVTNELQTIPKGEAGEFRIETKDGVILQVIGDKINIKTKTFNTDLEFILNFILEHTHLGNTGTPTGPPASSPVPIASADPPAPASPASFKGGKL